MSVIIDGGLQINPWTTDPDKVYLAALSHLAVLSPIGHLIAFQLFTSVFSRDVILKYQK